MSWDAIIAKTSDTNYTKPGDDAAFVSMGNPAEVRAKLNLGLPSLKWSSRSDGHADVGSLSLEFTLMGKSEHVGRESEPKQLTEAESVDSIGVSARGNGDPVSVVVGLAKSNHWSVADSQDGAWINLDSPAQKTWTEFTQYRDKIARESRGTGPVTGGSVGINLLISCVVLIVVVLVIKHFFK